MLDFKKKNEQAHEENLELRPTDFDDIGFFSARSNDPSESWSKRHGWQRHNPLYNPDVAATSVVYPPGEQAATPARPTTPAPQQRQWDWSYWTQQPEAPSWSEIDSAWSREEAQHWQWQSEAWEEEHTGSWSSRG